MARLDDTSISTVCAQPFTTVYSTSSTFGPGITLYSETTVPTILSGYIYVDYITDGNIYDLNPGTGVVG